MAGPRKLKVFRTSTGFHDAYVAAPSRKAALDAWGASKDLFAIGSAELVTDPVLTKEPLDHPGQVIKRSRGDLSEQLAALPKTTTTRAPKAVAKPPKPQAPKSKPRPRPNRNRVDQAEAALREFELEARAEIAELKAREEDIRRQREALEQRQDTLARKLKSHLAKASDQYEQALAKWREHD